MKAVAFAKGLVFFFLCLVVRTKCDKRCYNVELMPIERRVYNIAANSNETKWNIQGGKIKFHLFDGADNVVESSSNASHVCVEESEECHFWFFHGNGFFSIDDAEEVFEGEVYYDQPKLLQMGQCRHYCGERQQLTFFGLMEDEPMLYHDNSRVIHTLFHKKNDYNSENDDDDEAVMKTTCLEPSECYKLVGSSLYVLGRNHNNNTIEEEGSTFHGSQAFGDESKCSFRCDNKPLLAATRRGREILQVATSVSGSDPLIDVHSPQYSAACWIIYDDARQLNASDSNIVQRYVLTVLFYTLGGAGWNRGLDFVTPKHECHWHKWVAQGFGSFHAGVDDGIGVHCDEFGYVSGLVLSSNNLVGPAPFELSSLVDIEYIYFVDNHMSGSIPSELGTLQQLRSISLEVNALTGSIPESIGHIESLNSMGFGNNFLTGSIPLLLQKDVHILSLPDNMLTGRIPDAIGKWNYLVGLYLGDNHLSGAIPEAVGNSTQLKYVFFRSNDLVGTLPSKILVLPSLNMLDLSENSFTGSIPSHIAPDGPLSFLQLHNNQLIGRIPSELSMLGNLRSLGLHNNMLSGEIPTNFSNLQNLGALTLHKNNITGESPFQDCEQSPTHMEADCDTPQKVNCPCCTACHGIFTSYEDGLGCSSGELTLLFENLAPGDYVNFELHNSAGRLLDSEAFSAVNATHKYTSCVSMSGCFAVQIRNFFLLDIRVNLFVDKNLVFQESIKEQITNDFAFGIHSDGMIKRDSCDDFTLCDVPAKVNSTKRDLIDKLTRVTGIQVFDDASSSYYGAACNWMSFLEGHDSEDYQYMELVQYFYLALVFYETNGKEWTTSDMWVTNTNFCTWYGIECDSYGIVTSIRLPSNQLRGTLPREIGELRGLQHLVLGNNNLFGELPVEIGVKMTGLKELNLTHNRFLGSIPSQFALLRELRSIDASHNELSGSLPAEIGMMESVEFFNFFDNTLSGELPESFYGLHNLKVIKLGSNLFVGDASRVKNLLGLEILDLSGNFFTGTVPLGSYQKKLRVLHLSGNRFRGSIPTSVEQLSSLEEMFIYNNQLTGNLPSQVGNLEKLLRVSLSHNNIKGFVPSEVGNLKNLTLLHLHNNEIEGKADHFDYFVEDFITDCGNTYTSPARVECQSCSSCCNIDGDCLSKSITWPAPGNMVQKSQMEARGFVFLMTLASSFALVAILYILSIFLDTDDVGFCTEFQDESIYKFLLSKNYMAKALSVAAVLLQLFLLSIFIEASDFTSDRNDWEYSMNCPEDSIDCDDKRGITPLAWLAFSCILAVHLVKDLIEGSKMIFESIILSSIKGVFAGFVVVYVTIASVVASVLYNYSTGISNTDILKDAALLLFLNNMDEQLYTLVRIARPKWVERRNKSAKRWLDNKIRESREMGKVGKHTEREGDNFHDEENIYTGTQRTGTVTHEVEEVNIKDVCQYLDREMKDLQNDHISMKNTHEKELEEHEAEIIELKSNFATLETDYSKLQDDYNDMKEKHTTVEIDHNKLQDDYKELNHKHTALEEEVADMKKLLLALQQKVEN